MLLDKPRFAVLEVTGETLKAIEKGLDIKVNDRAIMPAWIVTKSESRYLAVLGSNPICLTLSAVTEDEMGRTVWLPEGDIRVLAEMEGVMR